MKRILITGAGGTPSTNFVRSLRVSSESFHLIGVDCNEYYLHRAETNERYLVPYADDKDYVPILKGIIQETKPDLIYSQPDQEIYRISKIRDELWAEFGVRIFLPCHETIELCQDKLASYLKWRDAGLKVPETVRINSEQDLRSAFDKFGSPVWIRAIVSPGGGRGSFRAENYKAAKAWIDFCEGWGNFTAAECLRPNSTTWMSIWKNGELIVAQGRKRMYWEFANRAPSGVTGITGTGITISDPLVDEVALKAITAIDKQPNGIFSVDLTYDEEDVPNPTEINIGRFFTTHYFFTTAGLNMPYIFVRLAFDEEIPRILRTINPLTPGLAWIRGMDFLPVLTDEKTIRLYKEELEERKRNVRK
ncbi:MAG: carboxylate--amine ligase [Anaerolineae bacterium]